MRSSGMIGIVAVVPVLWGTALATAAPVAGKPVPAFPGAEGAGSRTPGGRGGRVLAVTTLADSGPGSLREALTARSPRTVVFAVAGEIRLESHLRVTEPFVTVAGQTAPGSGITLRDAGLYVQTHDVVIRFIRSRVGASLAEPFNTQDALQISGDDAYNIVVDHCSFSWSVDECVGIRGPAHDVTFSWNIVSEALRQPFTAEQVGKDRSHSMALILGGRPDRVTAHHNLLAHCNSRMPRIQGGRHAFVNNVVYDWGYLSGTFSREPEVNFIANHYKRGPSSRPIKAICEKAGEMGRVYVRGNRSRERPADDLPEWEPIVDAPAAEHQAAEPFDVPMNAPTTADQAYEDVLRGAGATVPVRDDVDRRIVRQARLGMGNKIDRPEDVGGYPPIKRADSLLPDDDRDGMPNDWEIAQGFNPLDPADHSADVNGDGYTNLEEYLQHLVMRGTMPRPDVFSVVYDAADEPLSVHSGDAELGVYRIGRSRPLYYTQAWFRDAIEVAVESDRWDMSHAEIEPARYAHGQRRTKRQLTFTVNEEGPRVIRLGQQADAPMLVMFFEPFPEDPPDPFDDDTIDTTRFAVVGSDSDVTRQLQEALDACAARPEKKRVFVHKGIYRVGTIRVPSDVELHLGRGARLLARRGELGDAVLLFDGVRGSSLTGPGAAGGEGSAGAPRIPLVLVRNSSDITISEVVLGDPAGAGLQVSGSSDVRIRGIKLVAAPDVSAAGGLVIDDSGRVASDRSFISGAGDGITIDAASEESDRAVEDVSIRETVVLAFGQGVRVGPTVRRPITNVLVRDTDVLLPSQGIAVLNSGTHPIENLVFRDMTMDLRECSADDDGGRPFVVKSTSKDAAVCNVLFERVQSNGFRPSRLQGVDEAYLDDVMFWGCRIRVSPSDPPLFHLDRTRGTQFRFLYHNCPAPADKLIRAERSESITMPPEEVFFESVSE